MKKCRICGEAKQLDRFAKDKKMAGGRTNTCKACRNAFMRLYYASGFKEKALAATRLWRSRNPGRVAQQHVAWKRRNLNRRRAQVNAAHKRWRTRNPALRRAHSAANKAKRRSTKQAGSFSSREWMALCSKACNRCLCCKKECDLVPDHIIPLARGGSNGIDNIQPLCGRCNAKKGTKTIDYRRNGRNWRRDQTSLPL